MGRFPDGRSRSVRRNQPGGTDLATRIYAHYSLKICSEFVSKTMTYRRWLTVFGRFPYDPRFAFQSAESLYAQECRNISSSAGLRQFLSHKTVELTAGRMPGSLGDRL
jgi:hypothetical protein